ncbi:MAG: hypothetical protein QHH74_16570, partial [Spirochaetota bacterium]|nr:hypothetical protein [Spirochaetota bacterium]
MPGIGIGKSPMFRVSPGIEWVKKEPSNLILTVINSTRIDAEWDDGEEAGDGLKIYWSLDGEDWSLHGTASYGDEFYSLTSLPEARRIYVKVVAYVGGQYSPGIKADDYTAMKVVLSSTGNGTGVSILRFWFNNTSVLATLDGNGRFYSDFGGTQDESTSYTFPAGSLQTR